MGGFTAGFKAGDPDIEIMPCALQAATIEGPDAASQTEVCFFHLLISRDITLVSDSQRRWL